MKFIPTLVPRHAALLDMGNSAAVTAFVSKIKATNLPAVDMRGEGLEVRRTGRRMRAADMDKRGIDPLLCQTAIPFKLCSLST